MNKHFSKKLDISKLKSGIPKLDSCKKAKNVSESISVKLNINECQVCGSKLSTKVAEIYHFHYHKCDNCNLVYVKNQPTAKQLSEVYNSSYYSTSNKTILNEKIDFRVINIAKPKVDFIESKLTTENKYWLDIGSGTGEVLSIAKQKGFDVLGIEVNRDEREFSIEKFDIDVHDMYVDKGFSKNLSSKNFGVISMFGVLEHFREPMVVLSEISYMQKAGDNLVIEVPHYPSISAFTNISYSDTVDRVMHPPLHLYLFSLKSLEVALEKFGYEVTDAWFFGQDIFEFLSSTSINLKEDLGKQLVLEELHKLTEELQEVIDKNELSDEILVVAKKVRTI
jgi:2-polyprenyl-3-methyl-5-hydroxy-6-metoxy-1,4-benzoquinol methylase